MQVCVIGCGWIASSSHGPALAAYAARHPELTLAACCDPDLERARQFQLRFGFQKAYLNHRQMLNAERPEAVYLLTPPPVTASLACELLSQGIAVLLEKPPGLTLIEAQRIHAAAQQSGTPHLVAFNRRFTPLVERLRCELAERFSPGEIQHIHYEMVRIRRADADFSTTAIHGIDTVAILGGSPYRQIGFRYQPMPAFGDNVINAYLDGSLESGTTVHLAFLPVSGALTERVSVFTQRSVYSLHLPLSGSTDQPGRLDCLEDGRRITETSGPEAAGGAEDWRLNGFFAETAAFFGALHDGCRPPAGIETTLRSVAIMEAMRERKAQWASDHPSGSGIGSSAPGIGV